ncbi:MAG: AAA family ATPase [Erysipelotrichaceae bacterium]
MFEIDVINALDSVLSLFEEIKNDNSKQGIDSFQEVVMQDVFAFISILSTTDAKTNCISFQNKFLFNYDVVVNNDLELGKWNAWKPCCLHFFEQKDSEGRKTVEQLFSIVGKYCVFQMKHRDNDAIKRYATIMGSISNLESDQSAEAKKRDISRSNKNSESSGQDTNPETNTEIESLEILLEKLNAMIGLATVKQEIDDILHIIQAKKLREARGFKVPPLSLHLVFSGNPGTGKTVIARLLSKIYYHLGVLSVGSFTEVDRSGMVDGFVGQTALKSQKVIESAMGGILFIDEAYTLSNGKGQSDFGQEAIDTLLKSMEDNRDDFIVIVAGYPDLMEEFLNSNPGLRSRFNRYIEFQDYNPQELYEIFCLRCLESEIQLHEECVDYLKSTFEQMYENRKEDFANGRDVRNIFERAYTAQARRISMLLEVSDVELQMFRLEDFS